jgi:hypothetical protein
MTRVQVYAALKFPGTLAPEPVEQTQAGYVEARRKWHEELGLIDGSLDGWNVNVTAIHSAAAMDVLLDASIDAMSSDDEVGDIADAEGLYDDAGFVVVVDGEIVSRPMCCSSFGEAMRDWRIVIGEQSSDWSMVWIGHPWQMVRVVDGVIELSEPTEADNSSLRAATFPVESFAVALRRAEQDLREFVCRFAKRLAERGFDGGLDTSCRLLGVGDELFAAS